MFCTPIFNVTTELGQLVHDPWEERERRKATIHEFITITVEVTCLTFNYLNMSVIRMQLTKPHPLFLATFVNVKLVLAIQMADIECLKTCFTCCMATENTE